MPSGTVAVALTLREAEALAGIYACRLQLTLPGTRLALQP